MAGEIIADARDASGTVGAVDLDTHGLHPQGPVHWNLSAPALLEMAIARGEGRLTSTGAFTAITAPHTGRSPDDRFIVDEPVVEGLVDWGPVNRPISRSR